MSCNVTHDEATLSFGVHESSTTVIASFGGIEYYLDTAPAQVVALQPSRPLVGSFSTHNGDLFPCTVISLSKDQLNKEDLDRVIAEFALCDDVWKHAFLGGETSCRDAIAISMFRNS